MTYRRIGSPGGAARRSWAAVLAVLAAFVVLVHHDMGSVPAVPTSAMSAMPGMGHGHTATGHAAHPRDMPAAAALTSAFGHDGGGACSGADMQHCTSGAVGSPQFLAPPTVRTPAAPDTPGCGVLAGRGLPGNPHRAPPDLSVLSRLLI